MALKENSKIVFDWVKEHDSEDFTAQDIADATGLGVKSVNGIVTAAFVRHKDADKNPVPLMVRVEDEQAYVDENGNTKHKPVKYIHLTEEGKVFDPDAE